MNSEAPKPKRSELVLVGGMPRSGTTLLSIFIQERFRIPFSPETHYFDIAHRTETLDIKNLPKEVLEDEKTKNAYKKIQNSPRGTETFRQLLNNILGSRDVIGEKTPAHLMSFRKILESDHNVTCVIIFRNFHEIIRSLDRVPWNKENSLNNLKRCVSYYRESHKTQIEYPSRAVAVRYRDLCRNPDGLYLALKPKLPQGNARSENIAFDADNEPWKINALRPPQVLSRTTPTPRQFFLSSIASILEFVCGIIWPIRFSKPLTRDEDQK